MCLYLRTKFQVSSIILTSFREEEVILHHSSPTSKRTPKNPTQIRVNTCLHHHNELLYLSSFLDLGPFMLYLCDLFFIFMFIFMMINPFHTADLF